MTAFVSGQKTNDISEYVTIAAGYPERPSDCALQKESGPSALWLSRASDPDA